MRASSDAENHSVKFKHRRLQKEFATFTAMVHIYCKKKHGGDKVPCCDCKEILTYAEKRLHNCPFQEKKPTCGKCTVHCYKKSIRQKVQEIMRFSGPKMVYHHPIMALTHLIDGRRKVPGISKK